MLPIGGALLALAAFASTADARMMGGGGGMSMSPSMSHGAPMSASTGSPRGTDGHTFGASGRTFNPDGFPTRVKGSNWKKPIDSDGGGAGDPSPKTPKGSTQTSSDDGSYSLHRHLNYGDGYYGGWYQHHPHAGEPPLACRGRPGGC
jgi:hypothetical protein